MSVSVSLTAEQQVDKLLDRLSEEYGGVLSDGQESLLMKFLDFHAGNEHIYEAFKEVTLRYKGAGATKWSISGAIEVLRWQAQVASTIDEHYHFKIANDYKPLYARMLMACEVVLDGFFDTKQQTC